MSKVGGDDLADDFIPDDLVALSDPEDPETPSNASDDEGGLFTPDEDGEQSANAREQEKKRKRKQKEKERKAKVHYTSYTLLFSTKHDISPWLAETQGG